MNIMDITTILRLGFCIIALSTIVCTDECPRKCLCRSSAEKDGPNWTKVRCGDTEKISYLEELDLMNIANKIVQLNLSNNHLFEFAPKIQFVSLQKLDISKNKLGLLQNNQFIEIPNIRRLDVSNNNIKRIEKLAFVNLKHLERLKLNHNQIATLHKDMVTPLENIRQLDISGNPLACDCDLLWIIEWASRNAVKLLSNPKCSYPDNLKGFPLKKIQMGDFYCDTTMTTTIATTTMANKGSNNKGDNNNDNYHDGINSEENKHSENNNVLKNLPLVELIPKNGQVVFEGDEFKLHCKAARRLNNTIVSNGDVVEDQLEWTWLDYNATKYFSDVTVQNGQLVNNTSSSSFLDSSLTIPRLRRNHTGLWTCSLNSSSSSSSSIRLLVVSSPNLSGSCAPEATAGEEYTWPRTLANHTATLPCHHHHQQGGDVVTTTSRQCDVTGQWLEVNRTLCGGGHVVVVVSEQTRILEQFARVSAGGGGAVAALMETARHFRNYTVHVANYDHVMDVVYSVRTIRNFLSHLGGGDSSGRVELCGVLAEVATRLADLPEDTLRAAEEEEEEGSCRQLVEALHVIAGSCSTTTSPLLLHRSNMALQEFPVSYDSFTGMTCSWYYVTTGGVNDGGDRLFECVSTPPQVVVTTTTSPPPPPPLAQDRGVVAASVQIPASLFYQLSQQGVLLPVPSLAAHGETASVKAQQQPRLLVSMYSTGKLFPVLPMTSEQMIASAVVGLSIGNISDSRRLSNITLTEPIYIMLTTTTGGSSTSSSPAWYDPLSHRWSPSHCTPLRHHGDSSSLIFSCDRLSHYALLSPRPPSPPPPLQPSPAVTTARRHPVLFLATILLLLSLLATIATYVTLYRHIAMPTTAKHALINTWSSVALLASVYLLGVHQTHWRLLCEVIGVALHYFTLCTVLWVCVAVNGVYKRLQLSTATTTITLNGDDDDDDSSDGGEQPIKKPILGVYLVGWGISLMVCGISAAVNIRDYAGAQLCFLSTSASLSALYIPYALVMVFIGILALLTRCTTTNVQHCNSVNRGGGGTHLSENTQATEHVDLDLLSNSVVILGGGNYHHHSTSRSSSSSSSSSLKSRDDTEHSPLTQLKAHGIFLVLYTVTWICGGLATFSSSSLLPHHTELFSVAYAVLACMLGLFTVFFYGIARHEVRQHWITLIRGGGGNTAKGNNNGGGGGRMFRETDSSTAEQQQNVTAVVLQSAGGEEMVMVRSATSRNSGSSKHSQLVLTETTKMVNNGNLAVLQQHYNTVVQQQSHHHVFIEENVGGPAPPPLQLHSAEMFYNPHQSFVARRFFRKQKRNQMKQRNNLRYKSKETATPPTEITTRDQLTYKNKDLSPVSTGSCFPTSANTAKVNNTSKTMIATTTTTVANTANRRRRRLRNPNIFSDSCDEDGDDDNAAAAATPPTTQQHNVQLMLTAAEKLKRRHHKKQQNAAVVVVMMTPQQQQLDDNSSMRSVSQQCTLEYSSSSNSCLATNGKMSPLPTATSGGDVVVVEEEEPQYSNIVATEPQQAAPSVGATRIHVNPIARQLPPPPPAMGDVMPPLMTMVLDEDNCSRASSVCHSELDELYQQVRGGGGGYHHQKRYQPQKHDDDNTGHNTNNTGVSRDETTV